MRPMTQVTKKQIPKGGKMERITKFKGQSTLEYAVVIALVIAALVFMGWGWYRGAYQKRIMSAGDEISGGGQFDIDHTTMTSNQTRNSTSTDTMNGTATGASFSSISTETVRMSTTSNTDDLTTRRGVAEE